MDNEKAKSLLKDAWHFIWHEESILSWIANVIISFLLIYFVVYPVLGFILGSSFPIVAVVSGSMEHDEKFGLWWIDHKDWYLKNNITQDQFENFKFKNGFNKGDIMILRGKSPNDIQVGEILVFMGGQASPIIHRVVRKWAEGERTFFQTKGDYNQDSIASSFVAEQKISEDRVVGVAISRIPILGWIKIIFVEIIGAPYCRLTNNLFPCAGA